MEIVTIREDGTVIGKVDIQAVALDQWLDAAAANLAPLAGAYASKAPDLSGVDRVDRVATALARTCARQIRGSETYIARMILNRFLYRFGASAWLLLIAESPHG